MMNTKVTTIAFIALASGIMLNGCGGDDNNGSVNVTEVSTNPGVVRSGNQSVVTVRFSYEANQLFDDNERVLLTVQLPSGVTYKAGSAEIDRPLDDDSVSPEGIITCPDGSSFVSFDFDRQDLALATNPGGNADGRLTFTGITSGGATNVLINASASADGVEFSCQNGMEPEATGALNISA